jgi:hypothetical protein
MLYYLVIFIIFSLSLAFIIFLNAARKQRSWAKIKINRTIELIEITQDGIDQFNERFSIYYNANSYEYRIQRREELYQIAKKWDSLKDNLKYITISDFAFSSLNEEAFFIRFKGLEKNYIKLFDDNEIF